ncbi:HAMP domain-containing sensor histidine kinase [Streptomyces sp. NPDC002055]|uniref:HAMP domain-containing sensor histidine kinase n=1 Tax=Streptomyces sp. NPDC002055 TaxID=3154534 RepID=UPI00331CDC58
MRPLLRRLVNGVGGLRGRLVTAFVLVALISAVTSTALAYREARTSVLDRAQTSALQDFRSRVGDVAAETDVPPDRDSLTRFAGEVSTRLQSAVVVARYRNLEVTSDRLADRTRISSGLRSTVRSTNRLAFQRVAAQGEPWLVIGTPVTFAENGLSSGVEVFTIMSLADEQADTEALLSTVRAGVVPVVGLAVLLALAAAGTVLRPVRKLGLATRDLAHGELGARVAVKGRDELSRLARTFNETAAALQSSVAELRDQEAKAKRFVADVSHELRTPLAAMTIVSSVLDEDAERLPPDTTQAARAVSAETAKLARLVDDLIEISRFDAGGAALNLGDTDVGETVRATLAVRGWTDTVRAELPPGLRARIDRRRIDVVVANLVGNALRHGAPPVAVVLAATADGLTVEVSDHGPGLPPEVRRQVFDRFYKADTARTRSEGSGLGMAIALENARLHGGTLEVGDRPGGGALFTLWLPTHPAEDAE